MGVQTPIKREMNLEEARRQVIDSFKRQQVVGAAANKALNKPVSTVPTARKKATASSKSPKSPESTDKVKETEDVKEEI